MAFSSKVFSKSQRFTTAGANSFPVPVNVSEVFVTMVGGGASGGGGGVGGKAARIAAERRTEEP